MASASRPNSVPHPQMQHQQYCLRWNNYQNNLAIVLDQLLQNEALVDVTLACEGHAVKAHRVILAACSPYFQALFAETPCAHPIVILRDVGWPELKAVLEFVYKGEISVSHEQLGPLLKVAETLKIRGLADVGREPPHSPDPSPHPDPLSLVPQSALYNDPDLPLTPPPRKKRCREESPESPISREQVASDLLETTVEIGGGGSSTPALSPQCPSISPPLGPTPPPPNMNSSCSIQPINMSQSSHSQQMGSDLELKPGIVEMIREEERAKFLESSHNWLGATSSPITVDSYQYQLQSMWQKCWSANAANPGAALLHGMRFRERGPLKSWRPETMAGAIQSVLREGLSLSQAARKYDIPYPTFVLYANRVHNMLGPSGDGVADLRPKGRGRPQRILLGTWPDEHIQGVIRAVVFRENPMKDDGLPLPPQGPYGQDTLSMNLNSSLLGLNSSGMGGMGGLGHSSSSMGLHQQLMSSTNGMELPQSSLLDWRKNCDLGGDLSSFPLPPPPPPTPQSSDSTPSPGPCIKVEPSVVLGGVAGSLVDLTAEDPLASMFGGPSDLSTDTFCPTSSAAK